MDSDLLYQIAIAWLYRNRIGTAHRLLEHYGSASEVYKHISEEKSEQALERARAEMQWMEQHHIQPHFVLDDDYPYRLRECPDAPIMLYSTGKVDFNAHRIVSVVGTRHATDRGRDLCRNLVLDLARRVPGVTIVSGLAYGIDVTAHQAAIEAGLPTIIIPGHGLDRIYPALHRDVAVKALSNGGLLTEYMSGTEPIPVNFVARDRIIAGLADAVVVVESKERGGSLITAQMAFDYNRPVFAFPGRPSDVFSKGCNRLIRDQKAALIENGEDLVIHMMWDDETRHQPVQTELVEITETLDETEKKLMQRIREEEDGVHINLIVMETELPYSQVSATLMMMELKGLVRALPGGIYRALK